MKMYDVMFLMCDECGCGTENPSPETRRNTKINKVRKSTCTYNTILYARRSLSPLVSPRPGLPGGGGCAAERQDGRPFKEGRRAGVVEVGA